MKRIYVLLWVVSAVFFVQPQFLYAQVAQGVPDTVLITELQTTGASGLASEEFVRIQSITAEPIDLTGWKLEYFSASALTLTTPSRTIPLTGTLLPQESYLVASTGYLQSEAKLHFASTFAKSGGHVRLMRPDALLSGQWYVADLLGWGTAKSPEGTPAPAPDDGYVLLRKTDNTKQPVDTNDNAKDFVLQSSLQKETEAPVLVADPVNDPVPPLPTNPIVEEPQGITPPPVVDPVVEEDPAPVPPEQGLENTDAQPPVTIQPTVEEVLPVEPAITPLPFQEPTAPKEAAATIVDEEIPLPLVIAAGPIPEVAITELLPNPASPLLDSTDEYIELFNASDTAVDLSGYVLETGSTYSHHYTIVEFVLPPNSYASLYSADTGLALANSGGRARLVTPSGELVSETAAYGAAKDGHVWALVDGVWGWSVTATPTASNVLAVPQTTKKTSTTSSSSKSSSAKSSSAKSSSSKKTTAVKASTTSKKPTAKKTSAKVAAAQTSDSEASADTEETALAEEQTQEDEGSASTWVIAGVGTLALLYAGYEYRHDVANRIRQFRANRANRRATRQQPAGR